jgi:hypothetical protein
MRFGDLWRVPRVPELEHSYMKLHGISAGQPTLTPKYLLAVRTSVSWLALIQKLLVSAFTNTPPLTHKSRSPLILRVADRAG